jgi:hypothetical protein
MDDPVRSRLRPPAAPFQLETRAPSPHRFFRARAAALSVSQKFPTFDQKSIRENS